MRPGQAAALAASFIIITAVSPIVSHADTARLTDAPASSGTVGAGRVPARGITWHAEAENEAGPGPFAWRRNLTFVSVAAGLRSNHGSPIRRVADAAPTPTLGLLGGGIDEASAEIAAEIGAITNAEALRVLPILAQGSLQNLSDLFNVRGVDVALVNTDVLEAARQRGLYPDISNTIRYLAKLYDSEVHILARAEVNALADLDDKPVAAGPPGSGTRFAVEAIAEAFGFHPRIIEVDPRVALERLRRGELAALVAVTGKPSRLFSALPGADGLHFLPVPPTGKLIDRYAPATIAHEDYPALLPGGQSLDTISTGTALVVFNWPAGTERYQAISGFCDRFFSNIRTLLQAPYHPKWREVNLFAQLPGWQRYQPASEWLARRMASGSVTISPLLRQQFDAFLASRGASLSDDERARLYRQLMDYMERGRQ
jgi:TRAP-type uncharacterized transport system substrate-binding protein